MLSNVQRGLCVDPNSHPYGGLIFSFFHAGATSFIYQEMLLYTPFRLARNSVTQRRLTRLPHTQYRLRLKAKASNNRRDVNATDDKGESDATFFASGLVLSLSGAALIKYGSLASSFAFEADPVIALLLVVIPPLLFGIFLTRKD